MTTDQTGQVAQATESASAPLEPSFQEYVALRREGKPIDGSQKSAPSDELEQKAAADSEPAESEEDEASESEDESKDESEESDKPKKKGGGFQRKISKMTARQRALESEIESLRSQLTQGKPETPKSQADQKSVEAQGKPEPKDFETHAEYVEALTDWKLEQRDVKAKQEASKADLQKQYDATIKAHHEREKAFADKTDDYAEVIEDFIGSNPKVSIALEQLIVESENGPELLYTLAKDKKEFDRINSLPPLAAAREMGKLESKLNSPKASDTKPEPKKLTTAPKPIEPVGGSKGVMRKSITDPDISFADYERLRRQQMKRR